MIEMVEAAGVEPASETVAERRAYILSRIPNPEGLIRGPRSECDKKRGLLA